MTPKEFARDLDWLNWVEDQFDGDPVPHPGYQKMAS